MEIKRKVIEQSIKVATRKLVKLNTIYNANPASDLIKVREEARDLLEENKGIEKRTSKEFIEKIEELSKREKECWDMIEKQKSMNDIIDEKVKLENELQQYQTELFYLNQKN